MSEEVFKSLREHLDAMPGSFPKTDTGVELSILEHLFSPAEAGLALCMDYRF